MGLAAFAAGAVGPKGGLVALAADGRVVDARGPPPAVRLVALALHLHAAAHPTPPRQTGRHRAGLVPHDHAADDPAVGLQGQGEALRHESQTTGLYLSRALAYDATWFVNVPLRRYEE